MARLKNPFMSFKAIGKIGDITLRRSRKQTIAEKVPDFVDQKTAPQLSWRTMYQKAVALWHKLSAAEKAEWESAATPRHMTGFAWFMSQALRPNPGIYLPLAGGTMQGDIDMAGFKIEDLPDPAAAQEAATKAYHDANLPVSEGHITILPHNYQSIGQGTWSYAVGAVSQLMAGYWWNSTTADGDNLSYNVYLATGTYTIRLLVITATDKGIVDIDIDTVEKGSLDNYSAVVGYNTTLSLTGIVVATAGLKSLRFRLSGKHASSSDYRFSLTAIGIWRTA